MAVSLYELLKSLPLPVAPHPKALWSWTAPTLGSWNQIPLGAYI